MRRKRRLQVSYGNISETCPLIILLLGARRSSRYWRISAFHQPLWTPASKVEFRDAEAQKRLKQAGRLGRAVRSRKYSPQDFQKIYLLPALTPQCSHFCMAILEATVGIFTAHKKQHIFTSLCACM